MLCGLNDHVVVGGSGDICGSSGNNGSSDEGTGSEGSGAIGSSDGHILVKFRNYLFKVLNHYGTYNVYKIHLRLT